MMRPSLTVLSLVCLLAGLSTAAIHEGDLEVDVLAAYANVDDGPEDEALLLSAGVGYFVTPEVQVSGGPLGLWTKDVEIYGIGVEGKWHFMTMELWVPYVGYQLNFATADHDNSTLDGDGLVHGPLIGARYEIDPKMDVYAEAQYLMFEGDIDDAADGAVVIGLGILYKFQ